MKIPFIPAFRIRVIRGACGNDPYLIRVTLFELFGWSLKFHVFLRGDEDMELHDHPWSFWTLVLAGEYLEEVSRAQAEEKNEPILRGKDAPFLPITSPEGNYFIIRKKGALSFRPALWKHRVHIQNPCATLVLTGPEQREWGFHTPDGWKPWAQFISDKQKDC